jgi:ATP-dependent helicase HrpB
MDGVGCFSISNSPSMTISRVRLPSPLQATASNEVVSAAHIHEALERCQVGTQLPIFAILAEARQSLSTRPNLILQAPPGAGKTSILPLGLLTEASAWREDDNDNPTDNEALTNVWVVEPRRVAARAAAQRMAAILQEPPGQTVGYRMRGATRICHSTRITVVTPGVLLQKLARDPSLQGIDAVVVDEFHERSVDSDTVVALCLEIQASLRPDLRLILMSATLFAEEDDTDNGPAKLIKALGGETKCRVLQSEGRQYSIETQWARKGYPPLGVLLKSRQDLVNTMCDAIQDALRLAPARGDILAFLPGAREIQRVVGALTASRTVDAEVLPLYASLPQAQQDYALYPSATSTRRRIIVASPMAEASLTLERVTCVVDSGLCRQARCDVDTGLPRLVTVRCSQAAARQRAGRAGRVQPGLCLRLYSHAEYENKFLAHAPPEILSTDLVPTVLLLTEWGCATPADIYQIPFVDPPPQAALYKAYETLVGLQALEETRTTADVEARYMPTALGRTIAALPTHPRLATAMACATTRETRAAAVMTSALLDGTMGVRDDGVDLADRIRDVLQGPPTSLASQNVVKYATRIGGDAKEAALYYLNHPAAMREVLDVVGEALLPGFTDLVGERTKGKDTYGWSTTYMLSLGRSAHLDDALVRDVKYAVVAETSTSDDGIARIRSFAAISADALFRVAHETEVVFTVPSRGHEVRARRSWMVGALELSSTPLPCPCAAEVTKLLLDTIRSIGGVHVALVQTLGKEKRAAVEELLERVRLATLLGGSPADWPPSFAALEKLAKGDATSGDTAQVEQLVEPWLAAAGSLKGVDVLAVLKGVIQPDQRRHLDRDFPIRIKAPDGSHIPIRYANNNNNNGSTIATAAAKLQQFFGSTASPCVGPLHHRVSISLSLLSPSGRQVLAQTSDLAFFWSEVYPGVRAEMRGRYPKHPWPVDPLTALPTRQTKQQQEQQRAKSSSSSSSAGEAAASSKQGKSSKRGKRSR